MKFRLILVSFKCNFQNRTGSIIQFQLFKESKALPQAGEQFENVIKKYVITCLKFTDIKHSKQKLCQTNLYLLLAIIIQA